MDDRRLATVLLAALIVAVLSGVAIGVTYNVPITSGVTFKTNSNLSVQSGTATDIQSGNPFSASDTVVLRQISFRGQSASVTVDAYNASAGGQVYTNLSNIDVSSGVAYVDRPESAALPIGVTGTADKLRVANETDLAKGGTAEVVAAAGGKWTLIVNNTGLSQGTGLVVENTDTGEVLDAAPVNQNGHVKFDGLTSISTTQLDIRKGPSVLKVFKASAPTTKVSKVNLTVRVFKQGTDNVVERTVTDGTMDLTGIPKDSPLTITVDETNSTNYVYRRTIITSVSEQSEIYLLNSSDTTVAAVTFRLDDRTGRYPSKSTQLFISRPITKDFDGDNKNETKYQDIVGDTFGGTGSFQTVLQAQERYRLRVTNQQGDSRILGAYTAQRDDISTILIGDVSISIPKDSGYAVELRDFRKDVDQDSGKEQFVRVVYNDVENRTESLNYDVINTDTNTTIQSVSITDTLGKHVSTIQVNSSAQNTTYKLDWEATREQPDGSDKTIKGEEFAGKVPPFGQRLPIDPFWLRFIGLVGIVAVGGLVVLVDAALGAVASTVAAVGLTIMGIVTVPGAGLALASVLSVLALFGRA